MILIISTAPSIESINPEEGSITGNEPLEIGGENFGPGAITPSVTIAGISCS